MDKSDACISKKHIYGERRKSVQRVGRTCNNYTIMKTFKIRMKDGKDCGCKGAELQIISKGNYAPSCQEVKEALIKAGYKVTKGTGIALNDFEVI